MEASKPCVMVTDIIGYSRHMDENARWAVHLLATYRSLVVPVIRSHYGQVCGYDGDSIIATFHGAVDAVDAAIQVQRELADRLQNSGSGQLRNRIALHCGPVYLEGGNAYGKTVDVARHLQALGREDSICLSAEAYQELGERYQAMARPARQQHSSADEGDGQCYLLYPAADSAPQRPEREWLPARWRRGRPGLSSLAIAVTIVLTVTVLSAVIAGLGGKRFEVGIDTPVAYCCSEQVIPVLESIRQSLLKIQPAGGVILRNQDNRPSAEYRLSIAGQRQGDRLRIAWSVSRQQDDIQVAGATLDGHYADSGELHKQAVKNIVYQLETRLE